MDAHSSNLIGDDGKDVIASLSLCEKLQWAAEDFHVSRVENTSSLSHFLDATDQAQLSTSKTKKTPYKQDGSSPVWNANASRWYIQGKPVLSEREIFKKILRQRLEMAEELKHGQIKDALFKTLRGKFAGIMDADVQEACRLWNTYDLRGIDEAMIDEIRDPYLCWGASSLDHRLLTSMLNAMEATIGSPCPYEYNNPLAYHAMGNWIEIMGLPRPARVYTTPGSVLGKASASYEEAEYLFLTPEEARSEMLKDPSVHNTPIVVVDPHTIQPDPSMIASFLTSLEENGKDVADIQDMGKDTSQAGGYEPTTWGIKEIQERFKHSWKGWDHLPINLLDIQCNDRQLPPWLHDPLFQLIEDVHNSLQVDAQRRLQEDEADVEMTPSTNKKRKSNVACTPSQRAKKISSPGGQEQKTAGKVRSQTIIAADLVNCTRFYLLGQRGAVTLPHHDHHGMNTWATVLKGKKVWTTWSPLSPEERIKFEKEGPNYKGKDPFYVILNRGDTVVMRRPGTVHAPGTLEDCLMTSGCFLRYDGIIQSMEATVWELDHPLTTNEDPAKELPFHWYAVKQWLQDEKKKAKFERNAQLERFPVLYAEIMSRTIKCSCKPSPSSSATCTACLCVRWGKQCTSKCHSSACRNQT